jgi:hypothetical protein
MRSEIVERVRKALDALPPRYRVPIRLYHLDGLSHAKIASALDVPVGTVRSLVARARRKLLPLLADVFTEPAMTQVPNTRFLHVANGRSVTMTLEAAGVPGAFSIWADPLYEGPVPAGLSDAELVDVRMRYLAMLDDLPGWRAPIRRPRLVRRVDSLVRTRCVRPAESDPAPDVDSRSRSAHHALGRTESPSAVLIAGWVECICRTAVESGDGTTHVNGLREAGWAG